MRVWMRWLREAYTFAFKTFPPALLESTHYDAMPEIDHSWTSHATKHVASWSLSSRGLCFAEVLIAIVTRYQPALEYIEVIWEIGHVQIDRELPALIKSDGFD